MRQEIRQRSRESGDSIRPRVWVPCLTTLALTCVCLFHLSRIHRGANPPALEIREGHTEVARGTRRPFHGRAASPESATDDAAQDIDFTAAKRTLNDRTNWIETPDTGYLR